MALCPVCECEINLDDDTVSGELIECPDCGSELEAVDNPEGGFALQVAPQTDEDWGQ